MKKIMAVVWAILFFGFAVNAAIDAKKGGDRFILTRNAPVCIFVETGWQRDGLIPLRIDIQKGYTALDLAGIVIPLRVSLGKETSDEREMEIGKRGHRDEGRLLLGARQGRLFFEDKQARSATDNRQSDRICWAEI
jgi:hypothetical protein